MYARNVLDFIYISRLTGAIFLYMAENLWNPTRPRPWANYFVANGLAKVQAGIRGGVSPLTDDVLSMNGIPLTVASILYYVSESETAHDEVLHINGNHAVVEWDPRKDGGYEVIKAKSKAEVLRRLLTIAGVTDAGIGIIVTDCVQVACNDRAVNDEKVLNKPENRRGVDELMTFYGGAGSEMSVFTNTGIAVVPPNINDPIELYNLKVKLGRLNPLVDLALLGQLVRRNLQVAAGFRAQEALVQGVIIPQPYITYSIRRVGRLQGLDEIIAGGIGMNGELSIDAANALAIADLSLGIPPIRQF